MDAPEQHASEAREPSWPGLPALWRIPESPVCEQLAPQVFRVELAPAAARRELLAAIDERQRIARALGRAPGPPNSMHEHGVALEALGLDAWCADLREQVAPLAARLLPQFAPERLDAQHAYVVDYSPDADAELGFHADDSEVTLNLCLEGEFFGSELVMLGLRCREHLQTRVRSGEEVWIEHRPGFAILHAGLHRHRVDPIRRGRRRNLIVWLRSSALRARARSEGCSAWCGAARGE